MAEGNRHGEGGSASDGCVDVDRSPVQADQLMHQCEPNATSLMRSPVRAFDSAKTLKQVRNLVFGNAGTGITDRDLCTTFDGALGNGNLSLKCGFQCVGEKVQNDVLPLLPVDVHRLRQRTAVHHESQPSPFDSRMKGTR